MTLTKCQKPKSASGTFCELFVNLMKKSLTKHLWQGGKEKLDRPNGQPEHAERRRRRQIPPHLRLHNALPE